MSRSSGLIPEFFESTNGLKFGIISWMTIFYLTLLGRAALSLSVWSFASGSMN